MANERRITFKRAHRKRDFFAEIIVISVVFIPSIIAAKGKAPPRRGVEPNAEILQIALRIRIAQERSKTIEFLLIRTDVLLLKTRIGKERREWYFGEAQPEVLAEHRAIQIREVVLGSVQGKNIRGDGQRKVNSRGAQSGLPRPFILHTHGKSQAFPRPEQRTETENVRLAVQLNPRRVPSRRHSYRPQKRRIYRLNFQRTVGIQLAIEIASRAKQPVGKLPFQVECIRALEIVLSFIRLRQSHGCGAQGKAAFVKFVVGQAVPVAAKAVTHYDA